MKIKNLFIFLCSVGISAHGQVSFIESSSKLPNPVFKSWLQKGVTDMNNDGRDDIVRADQEGNFFILKQESNGNFIEQSLGNIQSRTPLSVVLADIDNNGFADILTGGRYNGVRIVKANADASLYNATRLPKDSIYTQASALADINNDGLLDIFVCNDDSTNGIWRNTVSGNFMKDPMGFDFSSVPLNRRQGNYGIVFTDVDNDGDLDAYLSKCSRLAPTDSTDQRRVNQLFINTNGRFEDKAAQMGMADGRQTWVTEFQDIDNDGDMDAFIANHYKPSRLMLNDGLGHFTDITASAGLLGTPDGILQALLRDFDNDGYSDLLVSGMMGAKFFKNNGNNTFTEDATQGFLKTSTNNPLRSFAIGDLNHDGFQDIYASYYYGNPDPDQLWLNAKNANHFLTLTLVGTKSNRSAVGSKIKIVAGGKIYSREIRAGESYGISNSLSQTIGLGANTSIESLEIAWASGSKTVLSKPTIDQFLIITEPACQNNCINISSKIIR